jgi:hypothetical protein
MATPAAASTTAVRQQTAAGLPDTAEPNPARASNIRRGLPNEPTRHPILPGGAHAKREQGPRGTEHSRHSQTQAGQPIRPLANAAKPPTTFAAPAPRLWPACAAAPGFFAMNKTTPMTASQPMMVRSEGITSISFVGYRRLTRRRRRRVFDHAKTDSTETVSAANFRPRRPGSWSATAHHRPPVDAPHAVVSTAALVCHQRRRRGRRLFRPSGHHDLDCATATGRSARPRLTAPKSHRHGLFSFSWTFARYRPDASSIDSARFASRSVR